MTKKLFQNLNKMTTFFCVGIIAVTFMALTMRLTFLRGMAVVPAPYLGESDSSDSDEQGLLYRINPKIYFPTAEGKGNIYIANHESNTHYIRVDIKLRDTGRSIYYSGDMIPGATITSVRLQGEPLADGVYDCIAAITVYDPATREKLGSEDEPVTVYIGQKP